MGYTLTPVNPALAPFEFGAFSFPVLLDACGYLFTCVHNGPRWHVASWDADPRMRGQNPDGSERPYPAILGGGFAADAEEASIMARMARNFVLVQRSLPESHRTKDMRGKESFKRDDILEALMGAMGGGDAAGPWPAKVRDDFTRKIEEFSKWAPLSGGFRVGFTMIVNGVNVAAQRP